jgi:hypothetical protein
MELLISGNNTNLMEPHCFPVRCGDVCAGLYCTGYCTARCDLLCIARCDSLCVCFNAQMLPFSG